MFTNRVSELIDRHNLARYNLRRLLEAADLPRIRLYDLRHPAATLALAAGTPIKVVSEMLGHAGSALTMDVYSHVLPHMQKEAATRLESLLNGEASSISAQSGEPHTIRTQRLP